jgi:acyl carrier protein
MEFSEDQIREGVVQAVARCLARSADGIGMQDALVGDLGMDSLDFIDLMFTLEKTFKVKIRDGDLDRLLKPTRAEAQELYLSAEEVEGLSRFMPDLAAKAKAESIRRNAVISMMTADSLARMVAFKLNQRER